MKNLKDLVPKNKSISPKSKILSFKEFCQYVYDPKQRIKALNLPEEERLELEETIERRKR